MAVHVHRFTFRKKDRLNDKALIAAMFEHGESFFLHPFKVVYYFRPEGSSCQVLISAGKRKVKSAVVRNRMKRRMREAYRQYRHTLVQKLEERDQSLALALLYVGDGTTPYFEIEKKIIQILTRLSALNERPAE